MRTSLITGANRGIGLELVTQLLKRGDKVIATARLPKAADDLAALRGAHKGQLDVIALDVGDPKSIRAALAETATLVDHLDALVNNAGIKEPPEGSPASPDSQLGSLVGDGLAEVFRVNAVGSVLVAQAALSLLAKGSAPQILNISSLMGSIGDTRSGGSYAYRMSKAALNMATRLLAEDLRPRGVAVRVVHPGWVKTRMGGSAAPLQRTTSAEGLVRVLEETTLKTTGTFVNFDGKPLAW